VFTTKAETIGPEIRASLPMIIVGFSLFFVMIEAKEAANLTTSTGVKPLPGSPPMVPLIPDIDFINVKVKSGLSIQYFS
jgi:hypothetical protein